MSSNNFLMKVISSFFDEVNVLFENNNAIKIITTENYLILTYNLILPNSISKTCFILPKIKHLNIADINEIESYEIREVFIIDIFSENFRNSLSPNEFFDFLFNVKNYVERFYEKDRDTKDIESLYVNRKLIKYNKIDNIECKAPIDSFQKWASERDIKQHPILLLGERGIGKTWFIKKFCLEQIELHQKNKWINPIPIYINLRLLSAKIPGKLNLFEILLFQINDLYRIDIFGEYFFYEALVRNGNIILILDGFDEMYQEVDENIYLKQIWDLASIHEKTSNFILTSRTSYFYSTEQINTYFSPRIDLKDDSFVPEYIKRISTPYNIFKLGNFSTRDINEFRTKHKNSKIPSNKINILKLLGKTNKIGSLQYELYALSKTPAFNSYFIKYFSFNNTDNLFKAFKDCIDDQIISFNINTQRAVDVLVERQKGTLIKKDFKLKEKTEILERLAWFVYETNSESFNFLEFTEYMPELFEDYKVKINDIKTQTVLSLYKNDEFKFLSQGILAYYVSSYLTSRFQNDPARGLINFGKKSFTETQLGTRIVAFLSGYLKNDIVSKTKIKTEFIKKIRNDKFISLNLPFLIHNLKLINILNTREIEAIKYNSYDIQWEIETTNNIKLQLINPTNIKKNKPFYVSETEITNKDFLRFINDSSFEEDKELSIYSGFHWNPKRIENRRESIKSPFYYVINDYHYFNLSSKSFSKNFDREPVVYISWFGAAAYCNWLSLKEGCNVKDLFYQYILSHDGKLEAIRKNYGSSAFRLLFEHEWMFLATEGRNVKYPWELLFKNGKHTKESREYKAKLILPRYELIPVKMDIPNSFNTYGIIGNVREWVDEKEYEFIFPIGSKKRMDYYKKQGKACRVRSVIKGSTWRKGIKGFLLNEKDHVYPENTNIDVGFRVASSVNNDSYINFLKNIL